MVRKATAADLAAVDGIYQRIHDREELGRTTIGWRREIYPTAATARAALDRDELFVLEDEGRITAAAMINQAQVPEYALAHWAYPARPEEVMVLHTLVVDPLVQGKGYGRAFVSFYEDYARAHACPYLRMDTNVKNQAARRMYAKLGFAEVGVVPCVFNGIEGVELVCLEKRLEP